MFTGIVLERGRLAADPRPSAEGGVRLRIRHSRALGERLAEHAGIPWEFIDESPDVF